MYKDFANFIRTNKADLLNNWMNEMEKQSDQLINDIAKEAMYEETSKEFV
ncbi:TPA: RsbR protein, partial [Listeria monocytogenes]|nr:RsbR protein [Listeria monocytogenes]